jgi:hypothetical protein
MCSAAGFTRFLSIMAYKHDPASARSQLALCLRCPAGLGVPAKTRSIMAAAALELAREALTADAHPAR